MEAQTIPQRLEKASYAGDVDELCRLLQEDGLLLHQPGAFHSANSPLHIAAALGHAPFVKEILSRKPEYALGFDAQGFTALHLACLNGHLLVVRELLQSRIGSSKICSLRDRNGSLPIHTAASIGNVAVLEEMLAACSGDVAHGLTFSGDSILHLAVKSNSNESVEFLIERFQDDHEFLKLRDSRGNTLLHLAIGKKQLQTVKLLLGKAWGDPNAKNKKGCTVLDVLLESPSEHGDLLLGEMIRAAGGTVTETICPVEIQHQTELTGATYDNKTTCLCINWKSLRQLPFGLFPSFSCRDPDEFRETRNTLMIVATLIATVTFQAGLNPPGGFAQYDDKGDHLMPGQALIASKISFFLFCDMVALLSSLSIILLMICGCPQWKYMLNVSMVITWFAIFATGLAFFSTIPLIYPVSGYFTGVAGLFYAWYGILIIFLAYTLIRVNVSMHRKVFHFIVKRRRCCFLLCTNQHHLRLITGVCMVVSCLVTSIIFAYLALWFPQFILLDVHVETPTIV